MQPRSPPIGIIARYTGGYYFGTMLTSMHHVARAAGVPLLIIQGPLEELDLPIFGAEQVAGWVVIHPMEVDADNLARLVASGAPVVTIATALENVPCSSVMVDNRGNTAALVSHLIDHGHQRIAYLDQGHDLWGRERYLGYLDALYHRGIALDPGLVLDTSNLSVDASLTGPQLLMRRGELAAQELIARGMPCSALVAGTDHSAIAAMQMLQVAGYRIPEDLAVVGFDDIAEAQYAQPPLTTVRTRFDEFGRAAVEYMLAVLRAERDARPVQIALPTKQLRRRSCGCAGPEEIRVRGAQAVGMSSGWQTALARQLIQVIAYPLELDPATEPAQIWPGVGTLIAAFEAALQGQDSSSFADQIERVWQQAVEITENQELLNAAVLLLEDAAPPRLAGAPAAARPAMLALFQHLRMAMMRARLAYEARKNEYLASSAIMNQDISLTLLSSWPGESQTLAWLRKTPANWGCLGLWADTQADDPRMLVVVGVYPHERAGSIAAGGLHRPALFPPLDRLPERALRGQDLTIVCPLRSGSEDMGVLALCGFADHNFVFDTESLWVQAALLGATLKRDTMVTRLEAQAHVLAQARDAAEDANRAKSAFLASMSHELRTPLNGILGYAQILAQADRLSPQQVRGIQIIQQSGEHLLTLITDILDLAKIEAGKLDLVPASIRFDAFLDGIVGIIRTRAEAKRLSFRFEQLGTLPIIIRADETRLRQILLNLLGNAVKFTERGGVTLRVSSELRVSSAELPNWAEATEITQLKAQNSTKIRFEVIDTGIGIRPADRARLFHPFEQIGDVRQRSQGTGLGLAISQQLLQQMGSAIGLESELGAGSRFWFDLVVSVVAEDGSVSQPDERRIAGYVGRRRTILIMDDNAYNRAFLADLLRPLGFRLIEAADGPAALEQARLAHPDLALIDLQMPGVSGTELSQMLRQEPGLADLIIIAASASVFDADRQRSLLAGCNAFLPKPIRLPQLMDLLGSWLGLTWRYAEAEDLAQRSASEPEPETLVAPAADELAQLFELASSGDILGLQARTAELRQREPNARAFVQQLERLAEQFELERALALISRYLGN